ncbi:endonuclease G, mitochondrial [Arctopsyche grandis]|uniref:endonuclease G, mitochondrial n=1 Tax=Arctopsyche grandis TaxID=121162 RepID=UPI00406D7C0B
MPQLAVRIAALGSVALGGYFVGANIEKRRLLDILQNALHTDRLVLESVLDKRKPAEIFEKLSFGKVSAATPMSVSDSIATGPARVSQIMKYGFPGLDNVRSFDNYVLSYDRRNRVAHWVFEHLTKQSVKSNDQINRSKCEFRPDQSVHTFFRSDNSDYKGSGFDRGHLAAAGNHRLSQNHVDQTFFLSNMAPQVGKGFNRNSWNNLEKYVRKLTNTYVNVYCCTGPLYLPKKEGDGKMYTRYQTIGANSVAVPTHFYKVIVGESPDGNLDLECFCMPNQVIPDDVPITSFQVPPESIERAAGLLFFERIPRRQFSKINGRKQ